MCWKEMLIIWVTNLNFNFWHFCVYFCCACADTFTNKFMLMPVLFLTSSTTIKNNLTLLTMSKTVLLIPFLLTKMACLGLFGVLSYGWPLRDRSPLPFFWLFLFLQPQAKWEESPQIKQWSHSSVFPLFWQASHPRGFWLGGLASFCASRTGFDFSSLTVTCNSERPAFKEFRAARNCSFPEGWLLVCSRFSWGVCFSKVRFSTLPVTILLGFLPNLAYLSCSSKDIVFISLISSSSWTPGFWRYGLSFDLMASSRRPVSTEWRNRLWIIVGSY